MDPGSIPGGSRFPVTDPFSSTQHPPPPTRTTYISLYVHTLFLNNSFIFPPPPPPGPQPLEIKVDGRNFTICPNPFLNLDFSPYNPRTYHLIVKGLDAEGCDKRGEVACYFLKEDRYTILTPLESILLVLYIPIIFLQQNGPLCQVFAVFTLAVLLAI